MNSQIDITAAVRSFARTIPGEGLAFLNNAAEKVHLSLRRIPYNDATRASEAAIRWRRTASQIIADGYVYSGKSCTDEVIAYIAVCCVRGYQARFVKLASGSFVHSVAEVRLDNDWYIVDVSAGRGAVKGEYSPGVERDGSLLWKKGRDAWDVGLTGINSTMDGMTIS